MGKWLDKLDELDPNSSHLTGRKTMRKKFMATRLDNQTLDALRDLAAQQDRSVSYLMRKACEQYVKAHQKKAPKAAKKRPARGPSPSSNPKHHNFLSEVSNHG